VARYIAKHIWNSAGKSLKGNGLDDVKDVGLFGWEVEEEYLKSKQQSPETIKEKFLRLVGTKRVVDRTGKKEKV